jgi:predicted metalloprotease with PDZ domain
VELEEGERPFYVYWVGELPYDSERIGGISKEMHGAISSFFGDADSPFCVFWRRVSAGYGGAGGYNSFLLEYSDGTAAERTEEAVTFLLSHETIHEYALMSPARQYDLWYREGVAQFYAVVAPFTAGAVDKDYLLRWLNNNAQSYYTGGTAGKTWQSIIDNYWTSLENVKAPYGVGFVYLAQTQGLITEATNGTKGLDDLVLELYRRYTEHEHVQTHEFLEVLSGLVGSEAAETSFAAMLNGTVVVPPADCFARFGLKMARKDAELFDLGFASSRGKVASFTSNRTRAEEAGLRIGDDIVHMWLAWAAGDSLDNMMRVIVRRDGSEFLWTTGREVIKRWRIGFGRRLTL